jgi:thymidylate synthase (FAD)
MQENHKALLDHGYVTLVDSWGSDEDIIRGARMSTDKGFLGWGTEDTPGDEKLLRYLWTHKHLSPFEMGGATFEVMAPIFAFREWHRHRTMSYNEMSARYVPLSDVNYVPTVARLLSSGGANKQAGSTGAVLDTRHAIEVQEAIRDSYEAAERTYQAALAAGTPKELARLVLPVGRYSRMRASANLRNWLAFLTLRQDPSAQYEIRVYADAVCEMLTHVFPRTLALFSGAGT